MSFRVVEELCIGCGACDYSCPTGALTKTDTFLGLFVIDPFTCDDCGICVDKCPVLAIEADPAWPTCHGHGCPLTSKRMADTTCAIWQQKCPSCGATLWRQDDGAWSCASCDMGMKVHCPKEKFLTIGVTRR
jgi:NAD-dependent dihydropyrimidine dehydrogenase PreA subunit